MMTIAVAKDVDTPTLHFGRSSSVEQKNLMSGSHISAPGLTGGMRGKNI